jgi:hypothetical protein
LGHNPDPESDGTPVGNLAMRTIQELDGDRNEKVLIGAVLNAIRMQDEEKFVGMLMDKLHPSGGNYFSFLMSSFGKDLSWRVQPVCARSSASFSDGVM